jgi:UDP-N-acetylglucosamine 2-epimerase
MVTAIVPEATPVVTEGTNRLVHVTADEILRDYRDIMGNKRRYISRTPKFWDGKAAPRIIDVIKSEYNKCSIL